MEKKAIKILQCSYPQAWYKDLVGEVFVVYQDRREFILATDYDLGHEAVWRYIDFGDCKVLE